MNEVVYPSIRGKWAWGGRSGLFSGRIYRVGEASNGNGRIYKLGEAAGKSPLSAAGRGRGRGPSVPRATDITPRPPSRAGKGESLLPLPPFLNAPVGGSVVRSGALTSRSR